MFTPVESSIGGLLIGLSCALALLVDGHIAGCSGILGPYLRSFIVGGEWKWWNASFMVGMIWGGMANFAFNRSFAFPGALLLSPLTYGVGGLLIGFGTRLGKGCTSGHGLCGLARFSPRSLVAVLTFMGMAALTVCLTQPTGQHGIAPVHWPSSSFPVGCLTTGIAITGVTLGLPGNLQAWMASFASGVLFGLGLGCSGMTSQLKVIGFLHVNGIWDPSLAFVMGCGLCVTVPAYAWARRPNARPLKQSASWEAPGPGAGTASVDGQLLIGSAAFGVGWGLCGVCPGPALAGFLPNLIGSWSEGSGTLFFGCFAAICAGWLGCDRALAFKATPSRPAGGIK